MRVLVWKNAAADRRSVTPATRSSIQSRPATTRVSRPEVTSATPSLTECSRPTTSGCAAIRGSARRSTAASAPGVVTTLASTCPVPTPSRTSTCLRVPVCARWSYGSSPSATAQPRTVSRTAFPSGRGEQARGHVHHAVPPPALVEAQRQTARRAGGRGVLHLVAVGEALEGRVGLAHLDVLQVPDAREVLGHLGPLGRQRDLVLHVLEAAAAAARDVRAGRGHAPGAGGQHLDQVRLGEAAARLGDPRPHPVARGRVAAEHDVAVVAGHARAAEGEVAAPRARARRRGGGVPSA